MDPGRVHHAAGQSRPGLLESRGRILAGAWMTGVRFRLATARRVGARLWPSEVFMTATRNRHVTIAATLAIAACVAGASGGLRAQRRAARCDRDRRHRPRWGGHQLERTRSGRLGDRGDDRPPDEIRQDGRDRRQRPLPHPRSSEGHLQRLGARLRARRFAQGADRARDAIST